jgi:hypothetical protein
MLSCVLSHRGNSHTSTAVCLLGLINQYFSAAWLVMTVLSQQRLVIFECGLVGHMVVFACCQQPLRWLPISWAFLLFVGLDWFPVFLGQVCIAVVNDDGMSPANRASFGIMILVRSMQFGDMLGDMTVPASYHGHVYDAVIGAHALG